MGSEQYTYILFFSGIGAILRLLLFPPKTAWRGTAILLSGPITALAFSNMTLAWCCKAVPDSLAGIALVWGLVGLSFVEGVCVFADRNKDVSAWQTIRRKLLVLFSTTPPVEQSNPSKEEEGEGKSGSV